MTPYEPETLSASVSVRDYERGLDHAYLSRRDDTARVVREALLTLYDPEVVNSMIDRMKPILADPRGEGRRRERHFVRAARAII